MKSSQRAKNNPLSDASFLSFSTFGFIEPLLRKGYSGARIEPEDVYQVTPGERTDVLCGKLEREWSREWMRYKEGKRASFNRALVRAFWKHYFFAGIFVVFEASALLTQTVMFSWMLDYLGGHSDISESSVWGYIVIFATMSIIQAFSGPQEIQRVCTSANRWRFATSALIYKKILRLSKSRLSALTTGHIVELLSSDANRYCDLVWFMHLMWIGPLMAVFVFWFLYRRLGGAVLAGFVAICLISPAQAVLAKLSSKHILRMEQSRDKRVQLISEIICGIRVIKMYCWEKPFGTLLSKLRQLELDRLWTYRIYCASIMEIYTFNFRIVSSCVLAVAVYLGYTVTAASVFPMFAMFNIVTEILLSLTSSGLKHLFEVNVSTQRIENFLLSDEKDDICEITSELDTGQVTLQHMNAKWDKDQLKLALSDVTMTIQPGQLVAIIGEVGSGKTALLNALAGEMCVTSGQCRSGGVLTYATQTPWIFSDTVRENVLFGQEHNTLVFKEVIDATALTQDLESLPYGELTRVGERGVTLSGGQKARLSLARAVYQPADIYLLDDPLSAVDTTVGRNIFDKCIKGYLGNKTRILVTHQLQYLQEVDHIIIMENGTVSRMGSYLDLYSHGVNFQRMLSDPHDGQEENVNNIKGKDSGEKLFNTELTEEEAEEEEERSVSTMGWTVYKQYFASLLGPGHLLMLLLLTVIGQLAYNGADWWMAYWIQQTETGVPDKADTHTSFYYLSVFLLLTVFIFVVGMIKSLAFFRCSLRLSKHHHDSMHASVVRSPTRFFDTNPSGRILNRFSSDMAAMDQYLPTTMYQFLQTFTILVGGFVVCLYLCPPIIAFLLALFAFLMRARSKFVRGQRGGRLLESVGRSPILTHVKASIDGLDTVRALRRQAWCVRVFNDLSDTLHGCMWTNLSAYNWYNFRMNITAALFQICVIASYMLSRESIDPALVAMSLSYLVPMVWYLNTAGRLSVDLNVSMIQVERVLKYSELPAEAPLTLGNRPPAWPSSGAISIENMSLKYHQDGPAILHDVNVNIRAGEKIGIVGRTGAGKSSLINALFRLAEPDGSIYIDGVRTTSLGLHDVRGSISIIPQDPTLFSGPIRRNLDPFEQYTNHSIWHALDKVRMDDVIRQLPGALDSALTEGGANFSVGQRQLLCLARAILKRNKLIVLDEATANVDRRTDELIQGTIRDTFMNSTVLTVAHRLNTVMDSDRIMVVHSGRVVEFDCPHNLLLNPLSHLSLMVSETGQREERTLKRIAETSMNNRMNANKS